jgi:hypothetical protein
VSDNLFAFAQARATLRAELTLTWLNSGSLKLYSGTRPATSDTAITGQILLATFTFPNPAGVVANGVFTAGTIAPALVAASGTAAWGRSFDATSGVIADCDVGVTGSGAMVELSAVNLVEGAYVSVVSFTLTEG